MVAGGMAMPAPCALARAVMLNVPPRQTFMGYLQRIVFEAVFRMRARKGLKIDGKAHPVQQGIPYV
jgi:hypothetical protein